MPVRHLLRDGVMVPVLIGRRDVMGDVVSLRPVEADADPRVADMCAMLLDTLAEVRAGNVTAIAMAQIRADGAVMTKWDMDHRQGHSAYLVAACSRLLHDLNGGAYDLVPVSEEDGA